MSRSSSSKTANKPAKKSVKGVGNLSDLDSQKLRKAAQRLKDEDERTYRRPWSYRSSSRPKRRQSSTSHRSSSEESMEIDLPPVPYQMGSMGLMMADEEMKMMMFHDKKKKKKGTSVFSRVVVPVKEVDEKEKKMKTKKSVEVDPWSVRFLNDAGILNKFEDVPPNRIALRGRSVKRRKGTRRDRV